MPGGHILLKHWLKELGVPLTMLWDYGYLDSDHHFPDFAPLQLPWQKILLWLTRFFLRTRNLNLSLGVLMILADIRLKSSYFVLNFFAKI